MLNEGSTVFYRFPLYFIKYSSCQKMFKIKVIHVNELHVILYDISEQMCSNLVLGLCGAGIVFIKINKLNLYKNFQCRS
jgi:hypothetical protein